MERQKKFLVNITFSKFTQDDLDAGESSESGFVLENETMDVDDIKALSRKYSFISASCSSPQNSLGAWFDSDKQEDRDYFEHGIHLYHSLHIKNPDGSHLNPEDFQFCANMLGVKLQNQITLSKNYGLTPDDFDYEEEDTEREKN